MMKAYLALQVRMTLRRFKDAGMHPVLAVVLLATAFVGLSVYLFHQTSYAPYIYPLIAGGLISKLSEVRRTEFLKSCFNDRQLRKVRIVENLICAVPFVIFLLAKLLILPAALLLIMTSILALVNFRTTYTFTLWTPFAKRPFEFTSGFRNTFYLFFIAYGLSVIAVAVDNFNLGIFALLLVFGVILSFYTQPENEYDVWIHHTNASRFLMNKIKTALVFSAALAAPVALVLVAGYPQQFGIILLGFLIGWAFVVSVILSKYSVFPEEMNLPQGILLAMCIGFPPLLLIFIPYLYKQSTSRLSGLLK